MDSQKNIGMLVVKSRTVNSIFTAGATHSNKPLFVSLMRASTAIRRPYTTIRMGPEVGENHDGKAKLIKSQKAKMTTFNTMYTFCRRIVSFCMVVDLQLNI